ncbi:hypothetical protein niasHT_038968 [Heterodera trifolii]|uniref:Uncharacterized protein n=1 Tax=Heterodera trifolii TaxID=157864 RepID=A0ABD2IP17_9BILA
MSNFGYGQQQGQAYYPQGANPYQQQPGWNVPPPPQGQQPYNAQHFAEQGQAGMPKNELGFNDQTIRSQFVRKVFSTVGIMLAVVAVMSAFPFMHPPMMAFVRHNVGLYLLGYITFFVVYIALICCEGVRRSFPANIILLGILTLSIGFMTMMITAQYAVHSVFMAFAITSLSCFGVALFATITKRDLTSMLGIVFIATMCLALFGLVVIIVGMFTNVRILFVVYAAIGAFLFMIWLAIDIQMVMGGRTYEISPEEHIFASITLFLDIIQIFWFLLAIFGDRRN